MLYSDFVINLLSIWMVTITDNKLKSLFQLKLMRILRDVLFYYFIILLFLRER